VSSLFRMPWHSMGCYLTQQALKLHPKIAGAIKKIVWLAPDVAYDVLDDVAFTRALTQVVSLDVFYSRNNGALKWPSRLEDAWTQKWRSRTLAQRA
jgi:esterase/lipase superfamily enzyme